VNAATVSLEIETCVGPDKEVAQVLLDAGAEKVGTYYPRGGAIERRSWPPTGAAEEILPHLPAILTATASVVTISGAIRTLQSLMRKKRTDDPRVPPTKLRIRRWEAGEPLLEIELETVDASTVEAVLETVKHSGEAWL
jgi:hypothetical protein